MLVFAVCFCSQIPADWNAEAARPVVSVAWSAETRAARWQRSLNVKRKLYKSFRKPVALDWRNVKLPAVGEEVKVSGMAFPIKGLQALLGRKSTAKKPKKRPPSGSAGMLLYYNPKAIQRPPAEFPVSLPLRHHTVRFVHDSRLKFHEFLKSEQGSMFYPGSTLVHEPGSSVGSLVVRNRRFDPTKGNFPEELLSSLPESTGTLLPATFLSTHESFTIHYREVEGVFFKSAFDDLYKYPLRKIAKRIRSDEKHDYVAELSIEALPTTLRDRFLDSVTKQVQPNLQPRDSEPGPRYQARAALARLRLQAFSSLGRDVQSARMQVGGLEPGNEITTAFELKAKPGTDLATLLNRIKTPGRRATDTENGPSVSNRHLQIDFNDLSMASEFLKAQLGWIPKDAFGQNFRPTAEDVLQNANSVQASLIRVETDWVLSISVEGRFGESRERIPTILGASKFLSRSQDAGFHSFTFDEEFKQKHTLPEGLAVSIESKRLRLLLGPNAAFAEVFATEIPRTDAVFNVSGNLHALWADKAASGLNPREVISLGERFFHEWFVGKHVRIDMYYNKTHSPEDVFARELFVHSMEFDAKYHGLLHLLSEDKSRFHFRADTRPNGISLSVTLGRDIMDAIETREAMVKQVVLADTFRQLQSVDVSKLLEQVKAARGRIPKNLQDKADQLPDKNVPNQR